MSCTMMELCAESRGASERPAAKELPAKKTNAATREAIPSQQRRDNFIARFFFRLVLRQAAIGNKTVTFRATRMIRQAKRATR
jgi:hypothetical protein